MKVCLLGAESTGKRTLAAQLAKHIAEDSVFVIADPQALGHAAGKLRLCDAVLVMGLDLPSQANTRMRTDADAQLRGILQAEGIAFRVVYGTGRERLDAALHALGLAPARAEPRAARPYSCEACSDPECEHRLFRRLLG